MENLQNSNPQSSKPNNKEQNGYKNFLRFSGIAFEMLGFIAVGVWVGYKLDAYFELEIPVFLLVGSMLALAGSIVYLVRKLPKE